LNTALRASRNPDRDRAGLIENRGASRSPFVVKLIRRPSGEIDIEDQLKEDAHVRCFSAKRLVIGTRHWVHLLPLVLLDRTYLRQI